MFDRLTRKCASRASLDAWVLYNVHDNFIIFQYHNHFKVIFIQRCYPCLILHETAFWMYWVLIFLFLSHDKFSYLPLVRARPLFPAENVVLRSRDEFGCWSAPLTPTFMLINIIFINTCITLFRSSDTYIRNTRIYKYDMIICVYFVYIHVINPYKLSNMFSCFDTLNRCTSSALSYAYTL